MPRSKITLLSLLYLVTCWVGAALFYPNADLMLIVLAPVLVALVIGTGLVLGPVLGGWL